MIDFICEWDNSDIDRILKYCIYYIYTLISVYVKVWDVNREVSLYESIG
jgi:hypothetical protein